MLQYIHGSSARYKNALECNKKEAADEMKKNCRKGRTQKEICNMKQKKVEIEQEADVASRKIDGEIAERKKITKISTCMVAHYIKLRHWFM